MRVWSCRSPKCQSNSLLGSGGTGTQEGGYGHNGGVYKKVTALTGMTEPRQTRLRQWGCSRNLDLGIHVLNTSWSA